MTGLTQQLFLEQLLFWSSTFFSAVIFSEELLFLGKASTEGPVTSWEKWIGSCSGKLLFRRTNLFRTKISTEELLFKTDTFTQHQTFQDSYFFSKAYFWEKQYLGAPTFLDIYFLKRLLFQKSYFSIRLFFHNTFFQKSYIFHSYTSFLSSKVSSTTLWELSFVDLLLFKVGRTLTSQKKFFWFASMIALQKWWKTVFIS